MNCQPTSDPIQVFESMLDDTRNISQKPSYGPIGTFNSFNPHKVLKRRIDYIFSKNINILSHRQIDDRRQNGLCVSDHLPIMVEIE
jgi:endonuclease/exonuclease/phosphatase family metal-dependent hydrolase